MKVWMRGLALSLMASQARSMSPGRVRQSAAMAGPWTLRATIRTAAKSSSEAIGKPASITSTFSAASCRAMRSFSWGCMLQPGLCSPSRSVVSNIWIRSDMGRPSGMGIPITRPRPERVHDYWDSLGGNNPGQ